MLVDWQERIPCICQRRSKVGKEILNIDTARFVMNLKNPSEKQRLHNQTETKEFVIEESVNRA